MSDLAEREWTRKISALAISKGLNPDMLQDNVMEWGVDSPPVMGCMVALVESALGYEISLVRMDDIHGIWEVWRAEGILLCGADTRVDALVLALETAP